jgi:integrase
MPRKADPMPRSEPRPFPPIGVKISTDMERRTYGIRARARWTDPSSKRRVIRTEIVDDEAAAHAFFDDLRNSSVKGMDVSMTLKEFVTSIGDRWARGLDPTSTADTYAFGLKLRVLPALGHLPVSQITAGMIDRTIDEWETRYGASTIKNTIAPMVRVLDEAVRDGLLTINPAKTRAKRSLTRNAFREQPAEGAPPRLHAIPDLATLNMVAAACARVHQSYSDFVMLAALLAARSSEVSGLQVGDVRFENNLIVIRRQIFPGKGGLVTKATKNRKERRVPILDPLRPVLERLTAGKQPGDQLLTGPKGGVLTTATVRDATNWDQLVVDIGLPDLTRHGLRHTGATWLADAGVPLHVLQDILGHASIETTRGYLHPDDRHLASAAEQANAFLSRSARPATKTEAAQQRHHRGL